MNRREAMKTGIGVAVGFGLLSAVGVMATERPIDDSIIRGKVFDCPDGKLPKGVFDNCTFYTHGKFNGLYHKSNKALIHNCTVNNNVEEGRRC